MLANHRAWTLAEGVHSVIRIPAYPALARWPSRRQRDAVVIPIKDGHVGWLPEGCRLLASELGVVSLLADKARFAAYMQQTGLGD